MLDIFEAIDFATLAHKGQIRKGTGMPYITHPISVMRLLMNYDCSPELAVAGVLHDTVEDTFVTHSDIEAKFGARVNFLVAGGSEPDKSLSWEERKQHTINFLKTTDDKEIALLACADKLDNLSSTLMAKELQGDSVWDRFKRGKKEQWWYYNEVADAVKNLTLGSPLYRKLVQTIGMVF